MKIKLDENLPESLVGHLGRLGHDVDTVLLERLQGHPDVDIWSAAQEAGRFLITQDLDFSDIRTFEPGTHHGLLLVRLRLPGRTALARRVLGAFEQEAVASWPGCFVVISERKIRVHRPT